MMRLFPSTASRAFTLVELMIAIAIFATVMIAIYSSWSAILRSSQVGKAAAAEAQRERIAVRAVEDALKAIQMFQENIRYYSFHADTSTEDTSLSFVARLPRSFPRAGNFGEQVVRRVTFTVEPRANSGKTLVLRQNPILFELNVDEDENPLILARNVDLFTVEFWGPNSKDWEPEWLLTNQLPRFIRFSLGFTAPNQKVVRAAEPITRVVTLTSVAIPRGMQVGGRPAGGPPGGNPPPGRGSTTPPGTGVRTPPE